MPSPQREIKTPAKSKAALRPRLQPGSRKNEVRAIVRRKKPAKKVIAIIVLLAGGVLVPLGILIGFLDGYGLHQKPQKSDAIVVLGARVNENGGAGHGLEARVLHALRLYKKGFASRIICTGGVGDNPPAEAEVAAKILVQKGVPRTNIFVENKSTSTWENAVFAARICRAHGWKRVVVVSDPFHLWRAQRNFARNGIRTSGAPVAREQWQSQPLRKLFWTAREALLVVRDKIQGRV